MNKDLQCISLVNHHEDWTELFATEKEKIKKVFNNPDLDISHIGSTTIPNLLSQSIIDILIITKDFNNYLKTLESLGYAKVGICIKNDAYFFAKEQEEVSYRIVHFQTPSHTINKQAGAYKLFTHVLASNEQTVKEFEALKIQFNGDPARYEEHKKNFIKSVVKKTIEDMQKFHEKTRGYVFPIHFHCKSPNLILPRSTAFNHGSCFFLRIEGNLFGVTAHHVIQGYKDTLKIYPDSCSISIGNSPLLNFMDKIIAEDKDHDIATFRLGEDDVANIKIPNEDGTIREIKPFEYSRAEWEELAMPRIGETILFTGYPGESLNLDMPNASAFFTQKSYGSIITDDKPVESAFYIKKDDLIELSNENSYTLNLGGVSGAPAMILSPSYKDGLYVCGLISLGGNLWDRGRIKVKHLSRISWNGKIVKRSKNYMVD